MATTQNNAQEAKRPEAPPQQQPPEREPSATSLLDKIVAQGTIGERRDLAVLAQVEFQQKQRLAKMFVKSGCFADVDKENGEWLSEDVSIARAMLKIELGEAMGFSAAESMGGIELIRGRPAIGAHLRAARMQMAGYSWPAMRVTDKGCWIPLEYQGKPMLHQQVDENGKPMFENGKPVMVQVVVKFDEGDATRQGLLEKSGSMYRRDPSSMYYARAISRAQRRYAPAALKGIAVLDTFEAQDIAEYVPPDPKAFEDAANAAGGVDTLAGRVAAAVGKKPEPKAEDPMDKPKEAAKPAVVEQPKAAREQPAITVDSMPDPEIGEPGQRIFFGAEELTMQPDRKWKVTGRNPQWKGNGGSKPPQQAKSGDFF